MAIITLEIFGTGIDKFKGQLILVKTLFFFDDEDALSFENKL
jgi:hypothetical protein